MFSYCSSRGNFLCSISFLGHKGNLEKKKAPIWKPRVAYLFSYELLPLHVLLLLLLLLQDLLLMLLLLLLFQRRCHSCLAAQVRRVTVVTCHGVGPRLGAHAVVSRCRCHGVGGARAMWRSWVGVLVLLETEMSSAGAAWGEVVPFGETFSWKILLESFW